MSGTVILIATAISLALIFGGFYLVAEDVITTKAQASVVVVAAITVWIIAFIYEFLTYVNSIILSSPFLF